MLYGVHLAMSSIQTHNNEPAIYILNTLKYNISSKLDLIIKD